jgi:hypothetical protein
MRAGGQQRESGAATSARRGHSRESRMPWRSMVSAGCRPRVPSRVPSIDRVESSIHSLLQFRDSAQSLGTALHRDPRAHFSRPGAAANWLSSAFGSTVRLRIANHRIEMKAGDGCATIAEGTLVPNNSHMIQIRIEQRADRTRLRADRARRGMPDSSDVSALIVRVISWQEDVVSHLYGAWPGATTQTLATRFGRGQPQMFDAPIPYLSRLRAQ